MTEIQPPPRRVINNNPVEVIQRLPAIGNLMIIGKRNGATHERIGAVETVTIEGNSVLCRGAAHDSRIDASLITSIMIDTSSIMAGNVYPRIDFNREDGEQVFAIVGFGGLEPFEAALKGLNIITDPELPARPPRPERVPVDPADAGFPPLNAALASAKTITIAFDEPGFSQRWTGVVPKVNPGMGFINIMTEDFHLHLLGGTVGKWQSETATDGVTFMALDLNGNPTGMTLHSTDPKAFEASPTAVDAAP